MPFGKHSFFLQFDIGINQLITVFLKWTLPSSNLDRFLSEIQNRTANSVYPDETARYEPSHLDLHCLHRCLF